MLGLATLVIAASAALDAKHAWLSTFSELRQALQIHWDSNRNSSLASMQQYAMSSLPGGAACVQTSGDCWLVMCKD